MKKFILLFALCISASILFAGNPHKTNIKGFESALNFSKAEQMLLNRSGECMHIMTSYKSDDNYEFHTFAYNDDQKVIAIFDTVSNQLAYYDSITYNNLGQLIRIDGWQWMEQDSFWKKVNYIEYTYNEQGLLASRTNYNSVTDWSVGGIYEYRYNEQGQIIISELTMADRIFGNQIYEYENGKLKSITYNFDLFGSGMEPSEIQEYSYNSTNGFVDEINTSYYEDGDWLFDNKQKYFYDENGNCTEYRVTDNRNNVVEKSLFEYDSRLLADAIIPYSPEMERPKTFNNTNLYTIEHWFTVDDDHVLQYVCDYQYKYQDITGIDNNEEASSTTIFPNPASEFITIENGGAIEIFDMQGRIVKTANASIHEQISVSDLPSGNYIIKISNEKGISGEKLIINR